jgi:RHS repeat-associated protein
MVTGTGARTNYSYDALYRITGESVTDPVAGTASVSYAYDKVGNRLTRIDASGTTGYTYDANDRLLTEGSRSYTYDANGNTLTRTDPVNPATYGYDFEDRLTTATVGANSLSYTYDADGMRVAASNNGATVRYGVDSNRAVPEVLEERNAAGQLTAAYTYGASDLLSQARGSATSYYQDDGLQSTRALTDPSGAPTDTYAYDAFGNLTASTGSTVNDFLFNGQQLDRGLGLYNLRARYYSPQLGRFTTMDAFQGNPTLPLSLNKYIYGNADPVNRIDPTGHQGVLAMGAVISMDLVLLAMLVLIVGFILSEFAISMYESHIATTLTWPALDVNLRKTTAGTDAIAKARTDAQTRVQELERENPGCQGNILFHYTSQDAADSIFASGTMYLTRQWTDPNTGQILPRGVYATDIPPWANMTQADLAKVFYFSASRQARADLSWTVVICNDIPPLFEPLGGGQWVKPDGNVHVIGILPNAMP